MSGIATKTNYFAKLIAQFNVKLLDTRKTTPNFRVCEKWAVKIGGGVNHRFGLYDQVLIKDNHIKAAGDIKNAVESCEKYINDNHLKIPVVVEVKNIEGERVFEYKIGRVKKSQKIHVDLKNLHLDQLQQQLAFELFDLHLFQ
jgi:nicotinate-nucleotide pyrophosphorylase